MCVLSCLVISDSATPWTVAHQAPLSMGFFRQEYWSGLPFPPIGDLPHPVIEPMSPMSPALAGIFFTTEPPIEREAPPLSLFLIGYLKSETCHILFTDEVQ